MVEENLYNKGGIPFRILKRCNSLYLPLFFPSNTRDVLEELAEEEREAEERRRHLVYGSSQA